MAKKKKEKLIPLDQVLEDMEADNGVSYAAYCYYVYHYGGSPENQAKLWEAKRREDRNFMIAVCCYFAFIALCLAKHIVFD